MLGRLLVATAYFTSILVQSRLTQDSAGAAKVWIDEVELASSKGYTPRQASESSGSAEQFFG